MQTHPLLPLPTGRFGSLLVVSPLRHYAANLLVVETHVRVVPVHVLPRPLEQLPVVGGLQVLAALTVECPHGCFASFPISRRSCTPLRLYPPSGVSGRPTTSRRRGFRFPS